MPRSKPLLERVTEPRNLNNAWRSVITRKSPSARGSDGETIAEFSRNSHSNLASMRDTLRAGTYTFSPLVRFTQSKSAGGIRELRIPTIRDRIVLRAIHQRLETHKSLRPVRNNRSSFAYKPRVSMLDLVNEINRLRQRFDWIMTADIVDFFDNIPHDLALRSLEDLTKDSSISGLIHQCLTVGVVEPNGTLADYDTDEDTDFDTGLPQGLAISPVLSNIVLLPFDRASFQQGFRILRYADDIIAFCKTREDAQRAHDHCVRMLEDVSLTIRPLDDGESLSTDKASKISRITGNRQFDYVGLEYGAFGIQPSKDKIAEFEQRIENILWEEERSGAAAMYRRIDSYTLGWFGVYAPLCNQASLRKIASRADRIVLEWMHGKFKTMSMTVGTQRFTGGQRRFLSPRVTETPTRLRRRRCR